MIKLSGWLELLDSIYVCGSDCPTYPNSIFSPNINIFSILMFEENMINKILSNYLFQKENGRLKAVISCFENRRKNSFIFKRQKENIAALSHCMNYEYPGCSKQTTSLR